MEFCLVSESKVCYETTKGMSAPCEYVYLCKGIIYHGWRQVQAMGDFSKIDTSNHNALTKEVLAQIVKNIYPLNIVDQINNVASRYSLKH